MQFFSVLFCLIFLLTSVQANEPRLMLLQNYQGQNVDGWLLSEKLDGVRGYWTGKQLIGRSGLAFHPPAWFTQDWPEFPLDGELWIGRQQFEQTQSIVTRLQPHEDWRLIQFKVFDVPDAPGGLIQRLGQLQAYLATHHISNLQILPQYPIRPQHNLEQTQQELVQQGAEGLVLRHPTKPYIAGRSEYNLKYKPKYDAECSVTGYTPGQGKYEGQVGALICTNDQGQSLKIGSGLSDALRNVPPEVGTRITYQFSGWTQSGLPKHAVFWRIRDASH
jgi:DNA ligase-1